MLAIEQLVALSNPPTGPTGFDGDAEPTSEPYNPAGDESSSIPGIDPNTMALITQTMFGDVSTRGER